MPSANEFSIVPAENATIGGVDVSEGCSPAGMNNALRYVAAVVRDSADKVPAANNSLPLAGGTVTGDIYRQNRGAYLYHAGSGQNNAPISFLPEGSARPAALEGAVVFYYS